jgi:lysophospholipase L1-like esterase
VFIGDNSGQYIQVGPLADQAPDSATFGPFGLRGFVPSDRTVFQVGDSITAQQATSGVMADTRSGIACFGPTSFPGWLALSSNGNWRWTGIAGTFGYTPAQIRATHIPQAIAANPWACVVLAGTNGVNNLAQQIIDLTGCYADLIAANIRPILCTIPPQGTAPSSDVYKLNTWIKRYAETNALTCIDLHAALVDPATGAYLAAYDSGDHIHPTAAGAKLMGQTVASVLNALTAPTATSLPKQNVTNGHANCLMLGTTGGTNIAIGQVTTYSGALGTSTVTRTATDPSVVGNLLTVTRGDTDIAVAIVFGSGYGYLFTAGHRYRVVCKVKAVAGSGSWQLRLADGATHSTTFLGGWGPVAPITLDSGTGFSTVVFEFVAPTGLAAYDYQLTALATGVGASIQVGQVDLIDLTALGITP